MLLNYIFRFVFVLLGALNIYTTINAYHDDQYFLTGTSIMMTIWMATYLVKLCMEA